MRYALGTQGAEHGTQTIPVEIGLTTTAQVQRAAQGRGIDATLA